jgi:predicted DNA-binding transcriptional regulator AlpA
MTLLTQREAAAILKLSVRSLERYRVSGLGPRFVRCGLRNIRYCEHDIREWIASRVVRSTSEAVGARQ